MYELHMLQAKNYANAFLNVFFPEEVPSRLVDGLRAAGEFLDSRRSFFAMLCSSAIPIDDRNRLIDQFMKKYSLPEQVKRLLLFVADRGHAILIRHILREIVREGGHRRGEEMCAISSSHELSSSDQKKVLDVLSRSVGRSLVSRFCVDSALICGVKARGETFVWEKSIARRLMLMDRAVERGGLS